MATRVMDCDLVVLGAGGAGMVAAVKGADVSGKKVIVLEKAKKPGGATMFGHGFFVKDSKWQKEGGEKVNDPPDISGQFFDWLVEKGGAEKYFKYVKPSANAEGASFLMSMSIRMPARLEKYKDHPDPSIGPGWMGTYVIDKMIECCERMGIPVLTETRARKFITDSVGKVSGVLADTPDGQLLVNCKACFIGAGGFGADYEKCRKIWPQEFNYQNMTCLCPPALTGDVIDMAEEIGAAIDLSNPFYTGGSQPGHHPYSYAVMALMGGGGITINLNGLRWKDETAQSNTGPIQGTVDPNSLALQPKSGSFAILDNDMIEKAGARAAANPSEEADIPCLTKWREALAYEVEIDEKGTHGQHAKKADTLAELALKMDIDPKVFVATVERYNQFCADGKDLDFGREPSSLVPIRKPPFYAIYGVRFSQCTKGGILVNNQTEVFDKDGDIMPGLFAGGDCITNKDEKRTVSGGGLGNAIKMGYRGGITAGNYIKNL